MTSAIKDETAPYITREGNEYVLRSSQRFPGSPEEIFPFFSDATNLERITPDSIKFKILTPLPIDMHVGTLIDYSLRIRGMPIKWRTLISEWAPPFRFVDEQLKGPYRQWIHEHRFTDEGPTTLMEDTVRYKVYGGALINSLFVQPDLMKIFTNRIKVLRKQFPIA
ncbi:MAG: SRPBCC family protein [Pirellulales bacterium]|nr:SRPBCC family protein [Pirellulales bacterium]